MTLLFDLAYALAAVVFSPWLIYRRWQRGPSGVPLAEYFGRVPSRAVSAHCVWVHGVSLGEINAARTIVEELRRRAPDVTVVVSSTTRTGLVRARELFPKLQTFRFPLDFSFAIRTLLERIRPTAIVLLELEAWPNLLEIARRRGIPVLIANGRVTEEKSMRRFRRGPLRWVARRMFNSLRWVGAQDATYAGRFVELGVPADRVHIIGSVKYDAADLADRITGQDELAAEMGIDPRRPLWVCGSTGPGEEAQILAAYAKVLPHSGNLQLAIVPRKPERFGEVAELIVKNGYACLRRSTGAPLVPKGVVEPRPVFLGDSMGELRKFYALATVVFVGRTLVPMGGSDVMEVAGLGKAMIVGPHTENFAEAVELLMAESGCRKIADGEMLSAVVAELLRHPERRAAMGAAARRAIAERRGATARTVDVILGAMRGE